MQIRLTGRHLDVTPAIREYTEKKISSLKKYFDHILEAHVILKVEKDRQCCEIIMPVDGFSLYSEEIGEDLYASIDKAVTRMERQLIKIKEKIKSKNHKEIRDLQTEPPAADVVVTATNEPELVKVDRIAKKPMSVNEAMIQLDISKNNFLVFINADDDQINVIYRRLGGDFGLIAKG